MNKLDRKFMRHIVHDTITSLEIQWWIETLPYITKDKKQDYISKNRKTIQKQNRITNNFLIKLSGNTL